MTITLSLLALSDSACTVRAGRNGPLWSRLTRVTNGTALQVHYAPLIAPERTGWSLRTGTPQTVRRRVPGPSCIWVSNRVTFQCQQNLALALGIQLTLSIASIVGISLRPCGPAAQIFNFAYEPALICIILFGTFECLCERIARARDRGGQLTLQF